jgi:uncharacterized protein (TIGR03083 family)
MTLDFLALLTNDIEAFAVALEAGSPNAEIAGCPGWTLPELGTHLGGVHRWARAAILTGAVPQLDPSSDPAPADLVALAGWVRDGGARLVATLAEMDPEQPTWHPFPVEPKVAGLWMRRQAQETSVHRWDAQRATGIAPTIETLFAADGIDEYWTVMLPRVISREQLTVPASVIATSTTDTNQRWVVDGRSGRVMPAAVGVEPAAEIRGRALDVLLRIWGRPVDDGALTVTGDDEVAGEWLALGGA